jgi:hypothetical protein
MALSKETVNIKDFRAQLESKKFCFCLPVRLGVFIVSLLTTLAGSIIGVVGWMQVLQNRQIQVDLGDEIAGYVHASIFTLLGLISIMGFVGSLARVRGMVIAYSVGIVLHLGFSLASGIFMMYTIFKPNAALTVDTCVQKANPTPELLEETRRICNTGMAVAKGVVVAIYVVTWILQLYSYFIVERYADQLEEEEMVKMAVIMPQQPHHLGSFVGYPHRFSYGAYMDDRRSYYGPQDRYPQDQYQYQQDGPQGQQRQRPTSAYSYQLPVQQPLGTGRAKDPSNLA